MKVPIKQLKNWCERRYSKWFIYITYAWALKNNQFNFDKSCTNRINFQIPLPLFFSDELLHFGTDGKCEVVFNVDSNWASSLIQIAGSNACTISEITGTNPVPAGESYSVVVNNGTNSSNAFKPCTITVYVTDLKLYLCRAHVTNAYVPRSITQTIALKQWCPYRYSLSQGTSNTILALMKQNRRITHIIIAFTQIPKLPSIIHQLILVLDLQKIFQKKKILQQMV